MIKRVLAITLLAGLVFQIGAQEHIHSAIYIQFTPGLTFEDGTPLDESQIEKYNLYCDGQFVKEYANDFNRQVYVSIDDIGVGSHSCGLSETVNGIESILSNTMDFPLGQRTPTAPTLLKVVPGA